MQPLLYIEITPKRINQIWYEERNQLRKIQKNARDIRDTFLDALERFLSNNDATKTAKIVKQMKLIEKVQDTYRRIRNSLSPYTHCCCLMSQTRENQPRSSLINLGCPIALLLCYFNNYFAITQHSNSNSHFSVHGMSMFLLQNHK